MYGGVSLYIVFSHVNMTCVSGVALFCRFNGNSCRLRSVACLGPSYRHQTGYHCIECPPLYTVSSSVWSVILGRTSFRTRRSVFNGPLGHRALGPGPSPVPNYFSLWNISLFITKLIIRVMKHVIFHNETRSFSLWYIVLSLCLTMFSFWEYPAEIVGLWRWLQIRRGVWERLVFGKIHFTKQNPGFRYVGCMVMSNLCVRKHMCY